MKLEEFKLHKKALNNYDEITVDVITQLGQYTGKFTWPFNDLIPLIELNGTRAGFYFSPRGIKNYCPRCHSVKCSHKEE